MSITDETLEEWEKEAAASHEVNSIEDVIEVVNSPKYECMSQTRILNLIQTLRAERAYRRKLERALEHYSNESLWRNKTFQDGDDKIVPEIFRYCDDIAREALAKKPEGLFDD